MLDNNLEKLGIRSYGVGITTLEEVFLKIGRGDEEEDKDEAAFNKLALENIENERLGLGDDQERARNELDDYTIAEQHETGFMNVFMTNLRALTKKKFLLQVRDVRTLVIEIAFPIFFIFAGLALSNIKFLKDGHPRVLSPTLFP